MFDLLSKCQNLPEIAEAIPVRGVISQLRDTLKNFIDNTEALYMETENLITGSYENFNGAFVMYEHLKACLDRKKKELLQSVAAKIARPVNITSGFISYTCEQVNGLSIDMGTLVGSTYVEFLGKTKEAQDFAEKVKAERRYGKSDGYCLYWEDCMIDRESPNFLYKDQAPNEATYKLFDNEQFYKFVDICVDKLNEFFELVNKYA